MGEKRIPVGKSPQLTLVCRGDMIVRGWAEPDVLLKGEEFQITDRDKSLSIESNGELKLFAPPEASLVVSEVSGDLLIKNIAGDIIVHDVKGNLALRNLASVTVGTVFGDLSGRDLSAGFAAGQIMGDLSLRHIQEMEVDSVMGDCAAAFVDGPVTITSVMGDANLKTINGNVTIDRCQRDVNLQNLGGLCKIDEAFGDVRLRGGLIAGKHTLNAHGDIVVRWPADVSLQVEAKAPEIRNRLALVEVIQDDEFLSGRLGDGETFLILQAKGRIILKEASGDAWDGQADTDFEFEVDLDGLGEHIAFEINSRMAEWSSQMEKRFGPAFSAKVEKSAQEAAARAERAAEKAIRKAEKAARRARWQVDTSEWTVPATSAREKIKKEKITEEEQLKILRMVETGIITPEEANTLLEAIEG